MPDGRAERLVAHALIVGAVKGAVAGLLLGALPAMTLLLPKRPPMAALQVLTGAILAMASFCGLDAASARVEVASHRMLLRFAAGFVVPFALAAPRAGILEIDSYYWSHGTLIGLLAAAGTLGLGAIAAGQPATEAHEPQSFGRIFVTLFAASSPLVLLSIVGGGPSFAGACGGAILFEGMATVAIRVAELVGSVCAARPVARWLEPDVVRESEDRAGSSVSLVSVGAALRAASREPARAPARYIDALERLDRLDMAKLDERQRTEPPTVVDRRVEALLGLGRLDEAERLADSSSFAPAVRAEVARRKGDLDGAAATIETWLELLGSGPDAPTRVKSARASAHAILALVRADQGRERDARAQLGAARAYAEWYLRAFEYLSSSAVERHIEERSRG